MNRSRRTPVIFLMLVSLLAAGFTRHWASAMRSSGPGAIASASSTAGLSRMNSYALALLLGGLRGPLVMILWPSAEENKTDRDLEDFDTKIEWIRLLQAEFDSVHLFQIWNKAYNISAQMANVSNKYHVILDAIDYGKSVDAEKPNDINIIFAIGGLYHDKLGLSDERNYYQERIREDSQPRKQLVRISMPPARQADFTDLVTAAGVSPADLHFSENASDKSLVVTVAKPIAEQIQSKFAGPDIKYVDRKPYEANRRDPGWRHTELDPILDASGNILPQLLNATNPRPTNLEKSREWNDGGELQYLKKYQPFPYGVSPLALGYNYFKRAQVLVTEQQQKHSQMSDDSVGSRPGFALKSWSEEEWQRGRRAELELFGKTLPDARLDMEDLTALVRLDTPLAHPKRADEAIVDYARTVQLVADSLVEYERHLGVSKVNWSQYLVHMGDLRAEGELVAGDKAFLEAIIDPANRAAKIAESTDHYTKSRAAHQTMLMRYYINDDEAKKILPTTRATMENDLTPQQINDAYRAYLKLLPTPRRWYEIENGDTIDEYLRYINRAEARLESLK